MLIRPERPDDVRGVRAVLDVTADDEGFGQPAQVVEHLRGTGDLVPSLCLVAEVEGHVVGYAATSRCAPDGLVVLGPLCVLPASRGHGIGTGLVHSVVAAAEALWYVGVLVHGDCERWSRFGFEVADGHGLSDGAVVSRRPLLVRPLPSSWPGGYPAGTVVRPAPALTETF